MSRPSLSFVALATLLLPAAASAAAEGGGSVFWEVGNLLLLLTVLVLLARKPVLAYLADRRQTIQDDLASSEQLLQEAEERLSEWSAKAARLDADVADIRRLARERAEAERTRILADAEASADRIRRDASATIDREVQRARHALREEAADLAMKLAEEQLRQQVNDGDRSRLVDEFVNRVASGDAQRSNGGA